MTWLRLILLILLRIDLITTGLIKMFFLKERLWNRHSQKYHFRDLQMTANDVRKAGRLDFLPEMQYKVTTDCDNSTL